QSLVPYQLGDRPAAWVSVLHLAEEPSSIAQVRAQAVHVAAMPATARQFAGSSDGLVTRSGCQRKLKRKSDPKLATAAGEYTAASANGMLTDGLFRCQSKAVAQFHKLHLALIAYCLKTAGIAVPNAATPAN